MIHNHIRPEQLLSILGKEGEPLLPPLFNPLPPNFMNSDPLTPPPPTLQIWYQSSNTRKFTFGFISFFS